MGIVNTQLATLDTEHNDTQSKKIKHAEGRKARVKVNMITKNK